MAGKIRILKEKLFKFKEDDTKLLYVEGACDNDATPPQGNFVTGSAFENVTSGDKYKYSETSGNWVLQPNEGGTGGGMLVVNITSIDLTFTMDKTYAEIKSAFMNGLVICILSAYGGGYKMALVTFVYDDEEECEVGVFNTKENTHVEFTCSSVNDYPTYTD